MISKHPATLKEIKRWKEEINWIYSKLYGHTEEPYITNAARVEIERDIKYFFDALEQRHPQEWEKQLTDHGLPPECIRWYRGLQNFSPVFHEFIDKNLRRLKGNDWKVLTAILRFMPFDGKGKKGDGSGWPSHKTIAEYAGVSEKNLWISLRRLREQGFLSTLGRGWNEVYRKVDLLPGPTLRKEQVPQDDDGFVRKAYR
jgi:hypothetical protein